MAIEWKGHKAGRISSPMDRIEADILVPGQGEPVENGCVILEGGRISFAGPVEEAPRTPEDARTLSVPVVMPGMWDCHGHFMGLRDANTEDLGKTPLPILAARAVSDVERTLLAGFTSVREPGGLGVYLSQVIDEGVVPGPHIYSSGSILSQTGGHADLHSLPLELVVRLADAGGFLAVCDGIPECLKAVRRELRRGAKLIKVCASGGVMSVIDHPIHQQFSDEELGAIVQEAARAERIVAAHCHGKPGVMAALEAGCRTIEHGTYLDEESAEAFLKKKAILVPTRFILEGLLKNAKELGVPDYAYEKLAAIIDRHWESLRLAVKNHVRIAVGTDIFTSGSRGDVAWGKNGRELVHLVDAGMKPLEAIEAATANGPLTLGPQAPKSGQLVAGYDADVIALSKSPLSDIHVVASPGNVTHVWKAGNLVKGIP